MQLLLDGDRPVLVTLNRNPKTGTRSLDFHSTNDNGTTTVTMTVVLGPIVLAGDYAAIGQAVMAVLA